MSLASKWAAPAPCSTRWVRVLLLFILITIVNVTIIIITNIMSIHHLQFCPIRSMIINFPSLSPPLYHPFQLPPYFHFTLRSCSRSHSRSPQLTSGPSRMCWKPQKGCRKATTGFSLSWDFPDFDLWNREVTTFIIKQVGKYRFLENSEVFIQRGDVAHLVFVASKCV